MKKIEKETPPRIYLGDKIITTKKFKPSILTTDKSNEEPYEKELDPQEGIKGIVVSTYGNYYGIDFEDEKDYLHTLDELLPNNTGSYLTDEQFKIDLSEYGNNLVKAEFIRSLKEIKFIEIKHKLDNIKSDQATIKLYKNNLEDYHRRTKTTLKDIEVTSLKIKKLEKENKNLYSVDWSSYANQYDKIKKLRKVKNLELDIINGEFGFIITTGTLTFTDKRDKLQFELGSYKIFIPLKPNLDIRAANTKKQVHRGIYSHPCIQNFLICMGDSIAREIKQYRSEVNIDLVIALLINFLEEPNYHGPHINAALFQHAQPVNIRPQLNQGWFNVEYWNERCNWDGDKWTQDTESIPGADGECSECGYDPCEC